MEIDDVRRKIKEQDPNKVETRSTYVVLSELGRACDHYLVEAEKEIDKLTTLDSVGIKATILLALLQLLGMR